MTELNPDPSLFQEGIFLRALQHRVNNGVVSAVKLVSAAAVRAEGREAKAALSDVVELLLGYAELHQALAKPEGGTLINAAAYIQKLSCAMRRSLLDRMDIRLALVAESLPLQSERCWRLGLIVHDLIANAAKHACFDARAGEIKIKLARNGALVNCVVLDNGSRSVRADSDGGLRISNGLAKSLGGRIAYGFGTEFTSVVLSFPMNERERQANRAVATRRVRSLRRPKARASDASALGGGAVDQESRTFATAPDPKSSWAHGGELASLRRTPDVLGQLFTPCHREDAQ